MVQGPDKMEKSSPLGLKLRQVAVKRMRRAAGREKGGRERRGKRGIKRRGERRGERKRKSPQRRNQRC